MKRQWTLCDLSNDAIFSDLQLPLMPISALRLSVCLIRQGHAHHYSTLKLRKMFNDTERRAAIYRDEVTASCSFNDSR